MFQRKICLLLLCLLFIGQGLAQTTTKDPKKAEISDELKGKATNLLNALARDAEQFQLPENRISARASVADLLWNSDEKQARQLFQNAVVEMNRLLGELLSNENLDENEYYMQIYYLGELRRELLTKIAAHDPVSALSAFQTLSPKKDDETPLFEGDEIFELELAKSIAANDPQRGFEMAVKSLETGFNPGIFETLENIYKKDAELGAKLSREILKKIKTPSAVGMSRNSSNTNSAISNRPSANVSVDTSNTNAAVASNDGTVQIDTWQLKDFAEKVRQLNRNAAKDKKTPVLTENEYKELIQILARRYSTQQYLFPYEVAGVMSDIDAYFPALAQAIRKRLASEKDALNKLIIERSFEAEMEENSTEEVVKVIEKKPLAQRDTLYHKAAEITFNKGDVLGAKKLYDKAKTKPEYDYLGEMIDAGLPLAMAADGNLSEVRQMLEEVRTPEEKIDILTTLAQSLAAKGNMKAAKEMTEEARATYLGRMKHRKNMLSVIQLSQAYAMVEPKQSFAFLENNMPFVNDVIAAGVFLDEFNEYGAVKNSEVMLGTVQMESYRNLPKGVLMIRNLANADFERTVSLADVFTRREASFYARFRIAQALLDPKAEETEAAMQKMLYEGEGC
jgi:hypothetical protein